MAIVFVGDGSGGLQGPANTKTRQVERTVGETVCRKSHDCNRQPNAWNKNAATPFSRLGFLRPQRGGLASLSLIILWGRSNITNILHQGTTINI